MVGSDRFVRKEQMRTIAMSSEDMVKFVLESKDEFDDALQEVRDTQKELREHLRCGEGELPDSSKKPWQSNVWIPKIHTHVKKATSIIRQAIFRREEYITAKPKGATPDATAEDQRRTLRVHLDRADFREKVLEAVEAAFGLGYSVIKIGWEPTVKRDIRFERTDGEPSLVAAEKDTGQLVVDVVDPENFLFNGLDDDRCIERHFMKLSEVKALSKGKDRLFDPSAVAKLAHDSYGHDADEDEKDRLSRIGIKDHSNTFIRYVQIMEYYGPVYDRQGNLVKEKARLFIGNEKVLLNPHDTDNPYWHKKPPYIKLAPIRAPFRKTGEGLAQSTLSIANALNKIYRMNLDGLLWKLLKMMQYVPEFLEDPSQVENYNPGELLGLRPEGINGGFGAFLEVKTSDVPAGALADTDYLDREMDRGTGVPSTVTSGPPLSRDVTAFEVNTASQESHSMFDSVARGIDAAMTNAYAMVKALLLQYWRDFDDVDFEGIVSLGLQYHMLEVEERLAYLTSPCEMASTGLGAYMEKMKQVESVIRLIEIAAKVPEIRMRVPWSELLERVLEGSGFHDADQLKPNPEYEKQLSAMEREGYVSQIQASIAQAKMTIMQVKMAEAQMQRQMQASSPQELARLGQMLQQRLGLDPQQTQAVVQIIAEAQGGGQGPAGPPEQQRAA